MSKKDPIKEYQLKDGKTRYKFNVYLGIDDTTGEQIRISRGGFTTRKKAEVALARYKIYFDETQSEVSERKQRVKFDYVFELWLLQYQNTVEETTYASESRRAINHVLPHFTGMFIDKIDLTHCQNVVNKWYADYKKAPLLISIFNRIFKLAATNNWVKENPMKEVMRPKKKNTVKYKAPFYERNQLVDFLIHVNNTEDLEQISAFRLLAYSGLRKGELHGLQWSDIDFINHTISIERVLGRGNKYHFKLPKTESSIRVISLDTETIRILKKYRNYQREKMFKYGHNVNNPGQLLFVDIHNEPLKLEYFNRALNKIITENKLPKITIHGFRHTHCSLLFEAGVSIKEVQDRLGHSSAQTTMNIYNHVMQSKKTETGNKFADFMNF